MYSYEDRLPAVLLSTNAGTPSVPRRYDDVMSLLPSSVMTRAWRAFATSRRQASQ